MGHKFLTARQERTAQSLAAGKTRAQAWRDGYLEPGQSDPQGIYVRAHDVATNSKVVSRVAELNEMAAQAVGCTRESLIGSMWGMAQRAEGEAVRVSAGRLIADMCGWIPRGKPEPDGAPGNAEIVERLLAMDPEQLAALLAKPVGTVISDTDS